MKTTTLFNPSPAMNKVIIVDRDGTLLKEPYDEQIDALEKVEFVPGAISGLKALTGLGYKLVMASNQDGLGTPAFPEETFWPAQNLLLKTLEGEGVVFDDILIDPSFPEDESPNRKPGTGMFGKYLDGTYDMAASWVIGDRETDRKLAETLGARALLVSEMSWAEVAETIRSSERSAVIARKTAETDIYVRVDLDGKGASAIDTGLKFLDHMLNQLVTHGGLALEIRCKGDLEVDEHHTIEDTAIALGECILTALGDKRGIERYGYCLPMDDCLCSVALDFGGRPWLVWDAEFKREKIGEMPTEMFLHFFKSLSDAAKMNLNIKAEGENEQHKIEGIFKALARSLKMAVRRDIYHYELPSTKGML